MDVKEIKKLIDLMVKNDLRELEIRDGDCRVSLKRGPGEGVPTVTLGQVQPVSLAAVQPTKGNSPAEQAEASAVGEELKSIVSPMVGTFYQAASPESEPFVQVGDAVTADTVICVVEAMKVMNEIKAGLAGTVEKVLVSNGEAVEFGQPMFQVRPA
ncbi:MAG: acetyl-CoA carboxylase biotin carboxyl carrier protein [Phycisphaerae bacterium]|nr:acetyl-CoA carboxylase biotin carboxyl carrier protein [Phycisphaerae bacterium]